MSKKGPRLGRGLDALLAGSAPSEAGDVVSVDVNSIAPNPYQPRRTFDEDKLRELADSIATHGVVQPILLRPAEEGRYELVAGERRWRAAQKAGLREIPALIDDLPDRDVMEIALIENLQREDLNPLEEARAYSVLQNEFGLTQKALSERVGVSRPQVANMLRLLKLPEPVQDMVASGRLTTGHAKIVLGFPEESRIAFAEAVSEQGLSVREAERLAARWGAEEPPTRGRGQAEDGDQVFRRDLERRLAFALNTRVRLQGRGARGRLVIEYRDNEELERLLAVLGVQDEG